MIIEIDDRLSRLWENSRKISEKRKGEEISDEKHLALMIREYSRSKADEMFDVLEDNA